MKIYVDSSINIDEFCQGWEDLGDDYQITSSCSDEYCYINKSTREIDHAGYRDDY